MQYTYVLSSEKDGRFQCYRGFGTTSWNGTSREGGTLGSRRGRAGCRRRRESATLAGPYQLSRRNDEEPGP